MTTPASASSKAPPRDPLEQYLRSLEIRDRREKKHEKYINIITDYADKAAARENEHRSAERDAPKAATPEDAIPDTKNRSNWRYSRSSPVPSSAPAPAPVDPAHITQLRADLASSNKIRSEQAIELKLVQEERNTLKTTTSTQARRIEELEKKTKTLERRVKDTTEELKGQRQLAEQAQDEMMVMQMEVNAKDKDLKKAEADVQMLTSRWMQEKGEDARRMNEAVEKAQK
ncbi:hypothetical protein PMIN07_009849 [Paraphaeosphaeria minitans]